MRGVPAQSATGVFDSGWLNVNFEVVERDIREE
jgi:hypothetical protein